MKREHKDSAVERFVIAGSRVVVCGKRLRGRVSVYGNSEVGYKLKDGRELKYWEDRRGSLWFEYEGV